MKIKVDENLGRRIPSKRLGAAKTLKERLLEMPSAKPYQIRQFLRLVESYNLGLEIEP